MREQIETLMKQAGTDISGKWMGVEHVETLVDLIIEECCKEIMYSSVGQEDGVFAYEYINHLKTKFGIKK